MVLLYHFQRHQLIVRKNFLRCNFYDVFSHINRTVFSSFPGALDSPTKSSEPSTIVIHDLMNEGCLSYPKTWAYQVYLLNYRLEQRRQQQEKTACVNFHDQDCVLMIEHLPVYTLGRGADEAHLTFLQSSCKSTALTTFQKLSRKARGPGTARLTLDRRMEDQMKNSMKKNMHAAENKISMLSTIEKLTDSISPVIAPNNVPVYRVERGGEGKMLFVGVRVCLYVCLLVLIVLMTIKFVSSLCNIINDNNTI